MRDHIIGNAIYENKQLSRGFAIILEIKSSGMHRVVADNTHEIECFLNARVEASYHESADVIIDVFAGKAELLTLSSGDGVASPLG